MLLKCVVTTFLYENPQYFWWYRQYRQRDFNEIDNIVNIISFFQDKLPFISPKISLFGLKIFLDRLVMGSFKPCPELLQWATKIGATGLEPATS
jgi:hypothetical protein